ncbi:MAG: ABC transporter permease [Patescibacteria group bacterium]
MRKYLQIIKGTWAEYMIYRLNFVLWRVRMVLQLLIVYFLWWAIFGERAEVFGYSQKAILTYVLLSSLVRTIVLATTTMEVGGVINRGDLSNFLIRPLNFFRYYLARDLADKALNLGFAALEVAILFWLLAPPIFLQTNLTMLLLALVTLILGAVLYFNFSLLLAFLGFWTPDVWAPRFLSFVIMEFFTGALFPLDILPRPLFVISQSLPFGYFIYFPLKVYLGQLSPGEIINGLAIGVFWVVGLWLLAQIVWQRGLRVYTAEGR